MRRFLRTAPTAAIVTFLASHSAHAADCPVNLEKVRQVTMTDGKGQVTVLEQLDSGYVRRIEELPGAATPSKTHIEAYQGLFAETITTINPHTTFVQYYKISSEAYGRLRAALPPKQGTTLTLDYEVVYANANTIGPTPAASVPQNRLWKVTYTFKGEDTLKVGDCRYRVHLVETSSSNADASFTTETSIAYSPDLKGWLRLKGLFRPAGKPESTLDRTIVTITPSSKS
jgi:hypothetical protein